MPGCTSPSRYATWRHRPSLLFLSLLATNSGHIGTSTVLAQGLCTIVFFSIITSFSSFCFSRQAEDIQRTFGGSLSWSAHHALALCNALIPEASCFFPARIPIPLYGISPVHHGPSWPFSVAIAVRGSQTWMNMTGQYWRQAFIPSLRQAAHVRHGYGG